MDSSEQTKPIKVSKKVDFKPSKNVSTNFGNKMFLNKHVSADWFTFYNQDFRLSYGE